MNEEELLAKLEEEHYAQRLGSKGGFDGGCPCATVKLKVDGHDFCFRSRCWRVSHNVQDLYVWGDHPKLKKLAEAVKKNLDAQEWYNPYTIIYQENP